MTTEFLNNSIGETLVAFHIGRGGRFYNPGHLSFIGFNDINNYTDDLFIMFENEREIRLKIGNRENLINLFETIIENMYGGKEHEKIRLEKITGISFGKLIYTDLNGDYVGLDVENNGTGCINIDYNYDTTYVQKLSDCSEPEFETILKSDYYLNSDIKDFIENKL